jgi:predicted ATPase
MFGVRGVDDRVLLERERTLAALAGWLGEIEGLGAGRVVFVAGDAGVGKTVLVRRFCGGMRGTRVLWGRCDPLATPAPLGPLVDIAAGLASVAERLAAKGARADEVARAMLEDLGAELTSVLVLEDLHWADEGTLDVLAYLARRVERAPVLVICTYRDGELEAGHPLRVMLGQLATVPGVQRLRLEPLSLDAVRVLADEAGRDAQAVFTATRSNQFFVTELLAGSEGEVPATVRDAVLARASRLDVRGGGRRRDTARARRRSLAACPKMGDLAHAQPPDVRQAQSHP